MQAQHVAIDGSVVTIEAAVDLGSPATTTGRIAAGWVVHELAVGPVADAGALLGLRGGGSNEQFSYRDGTLDIASVEELDRSTGARSRQVVAVWSFEQQAITGSFPNLTADAVVAVLDTVDVDDTGAGLALVPRDSRWYDDPQLVKEIRGLGLMDIRPLTRERSADLPRWTGARVQGGDLYRVDARPDTPALLLVSRTAATHVLLDDPHTADAATTAASAITVTWEAA